MRQAVENGMFVREVPGTGPALLFIHGLGESGLCFEHLLRAPALAGRHMLVPDLPGYGRSVWCAGEARSLAQQADHLADWIEYRSTGPVVTVGHSMGGVVALLMAERHPALVAAVVDVDGNKSPGDCVFSSRAASWELEAFCARGFDELRAAVHAEGVSDQAQRGYYVSMRLADPRAYHRNSRELMEMSVARNMAGRLGALPVPKLYVAGVPDGCSRETHDLLAGADVPRVEVQPSGHWPFIDQEEEFCRQLDLFLKTL